MKKLLKEGNSRLIAIFTAALSSYLSINIGSPVKSNELIITEKTKTEKIEIKNLSQNFYRLGPGDLIELKIYGSEDLSDQINILNDGNITLPIIGSYNINGLTINQATKEIKIELSKVLINPEIQIKVLKPRPIRVSIIGEVINPGIYTLRNNSINEEKNKVNMSKNTLVDAIREAGGITQQANINNLELTRIYGDKELKYKKTNVDLVKLLKYGIQSQNPYLLDGDIIKVNKAKEIDEELIKIGSSNLSPRLISVYVIGEVENPGRIELKGNTPLIQAILAAGGPINWRANKGNIRLIRIERNGNAINQEIRMDLNKGVSNQENPLLQDGDTIKVERNKLARGSDVLGAASEPASKILSIYSLMKILNIN